MSRRTIVAVFLAVAAFLAPAAAAAATSAGSSSVTLAGPSMCC